MTKKYSTKRALIASILALCMCFTMLIGTTFAWFTDSVSSSGNKIQTGNLDVSMGWVDAKEDPDTATYKDASEGAIFKNELWEPGYVEARHIKIANEGTLALKYKLLVVANGDVSDLSDVIDVYYYDPAQKLATDRSDLLDAKKIGNLTDVLANFETTAAGKLEAGEDHTVTIALKMQESAGNEYQNKSIGSDFSIVLVATQATSEDDSFGDGYDADAEFPVVNIASKSHDGKNDTELETTNVDVVVPSVAGEGNYTLETSDPSKTVDADGNTTVTFDITLKKDGVKVTDDGTAYEVSVNIGTGLNLAKVIHDGVEIPASEYEYDIVTGIITFKTTHFSPFAFTSAPGESVTPDNLGSAVEGGGFVEVSDNVTLEAPIVVEAGETLVLDLNGKTLSYTSTEAKASFAIQNKGTLVIKNGTITYRGIGDPSFGYGTNTVNNSGTLVLEDANIINTTDNGSSVGVDNTAGAEFIMNSGSIKSVKNAVRLCPFGSAAISVTINGGTIEGSRAIQIQLPTNKPADAPEIALTVNGGTLSSTTGLAIYSYSAGQSFNNVDIALNGGIFNGDVAFGGGAKTTSENVSIKFASCEFNGEGGVYRYLENDGVSYYVAVDTAEELKAAVEAGNIAVLTANISVNADTAITVASGVNATIDLNGYTLAGTSSQAKTGNVDMFLVKGTLNVANGTVTLAALNNQGWNAMTAIFDVTAGGVLNIDDAVIENLGGSDMTFCVHLNNWGEVTLNATGTTFKSNYVGIRAFNSGNDMNNVTLTDCDILTGNSCIWVHNWTAEDFGNDAAKAAAADARLNFNFDNVTVERTNGSKSLIRYGFTNSIYFSDIEETEVVAGTSAALRWALANDKNVLLNNDIELAAENGGYSKAGIVVNGETVDGNGYTLTVTGANSTWDCGIYITGGTVKNMTVKGSFRGVFTAGSIANIYLDKVVFEDVVYTFNSDGGSGEYGVYISNSTMNGWTSFSNVHTEVIFDNCTFGEGSGYAFCCPYNKTIFRNCTFEDGFVVDTTQNSDITFENCNKTF